MGVVGCTFAVGASVLNFCSKPRDRASAVQFLTTGMCTALTRKLCLMQT